MKGFIVSVLIAGVFLGLGAGIDTAYAVKANDKCEAPNKVGDEIKDEITGRTLACSGTDGTWLEKLPDSNIKTPGDVILLVERIAQWVFGIFLAVSVIFLVVGAFQFVTGRGDPAQVNKARETLLYSVIGIGLAFVANAVDDVLRFLLT